MSQSRHLGATEPHKCSPSMAAKGGRQLICRGCDSHKYRHFLIEREREKTGLTDFSLCLVLSFPISNLHLVPKLSTSAAGLSGGLAGAGGGQTWKIYFFALKYTLATVCTLLNGPVGQVHHWPEYLNLNDLAGGSISASFPLNTPTPPRTGNDCTVYPLVSFISCNRTS